MKGRASADGRRGMITRIEVADGRIDDGEGTHDELQLVVLPMVHHLDAAVDWIEHAEGESIVLPH